MTSRIARGAVVLGTATLAAATLGGCATGNGNWSETGLSAEIRRTSYGIPHIRANDYASVAYGMAYAYAQDNVCLLADQVVDQERGAPAFRFQDDHDALGRIGRARRDVEHAVQRDKRQILATDPEHLAAAGDVADVLAARLQRLDDEAQWKDIDFLTATDCHAIQNRQSQGQ